MYKTVSEAQISYAMGEVYKILSFIEDKKILPISYLYFIICLNNIEFIHFRQMSIAFVMQER